MLAIVASGSWWIPEKDDRNLFGEKQWQWENA